MSKSKSKSKSQVDSFVPSQDPFLADAPVADPAQDRFRRWPFAQRIAQTIASLRDPSSIVIGVYGPWGEGKTTILNFIQKELENSEHVICVRFNPWRFEDENQLLHDFFETLAIALRKSLSSKKEKLGALLRDYAKVVAPLAIGLGGIVQISPAESAVQLGTNLSSVNLDELRNRIEKLLKDEQKRIVVLMDDIDRLDKGEIQAVFKLAKLSADFAFTAYVMAFDDEIVAAALGEKYPSVKHDGGPSFLEKIVQVPLHLPKVEPIALRQICFEQVDVALAVAQIALSEHQTQTFVRDFIVGLEVRLKTPRMAKRYGNTLTFALPLLKGEVNPVDLMLIEGIRVFYPTLYQTIRGNPDVFLGGARQNSWLHEQEKKQNLDLVNKGFEGLSAEEADAARELIKRLFPRTGALFGNMQYGSEWEVRWVGEKRIASREYFNRFFSYAVPEGDVSDQDLEDLLAKVENEGISSISAEMRHLAGTRSADALVTKLRKRAKHLSPEISRQLALAVAGIGGSFPNPQSMFPFTTAFSQSGILVSNLVENIPAGTARDAVAEQIVREAEPVPFAAECFRWLRAWDKEHDLEKPLSVEEETRLGRILADRTKSLAEGEPLYLRMSDDAPYLLFVWANWRSRAETQQYLDKSFAYDPQNVVSLLKCYLPTTWALETGLSGKGRFERNQYDSLASIIDPQVIHDTLSRVVSVSSIPETYPYLDGHSLDEQVAQQFLFLHNHVQSEKNTQKNDEPTSTDSPSSVQ